MEAEGKSILGEDGNRSMRRGLWLKPPNTPLGLGALGNGRWRAIFGCYFQSQAALLCDPG